MVKKLKNVESATQTLFDLKYGEKHSATGKMRNALCKTWNMARKLKIMLNEKHTPWDVKHGE
jgi:hypothetical protein